MIFLDYSLQPMARRVAGVDFATVDVLSLHYVHFYGDVKFIIDEVDFSTHRGLLTLIDFAVGLDAAGTSLLEDEDSERVYGFTETDDSISFRRTGQVVEVTSSYASGNGVVGPDELSREARRFMLRVFRDLIDQHPALGRNPYVLEKLSLEPY